MYHIKEDKRAYRSAELIYQGLLECMQEKDFDKISITDIQRTSTVGRATFYRNFDSVIDVLFWKCDLEYKKAMQNYICMASHSSDPNEFFVYFFHYWMEHFEILDLLVGLGRYDIVFQCHYNNAAVLQNYFRERYLLPSTHFEYYMSMRIGAFLGILITWSRSGQKETAEELVEILKADLQGAQSQPLLL